MQDVSVINPQTASLVPDALATVNIISKILNSTSNPDTVNPCQSDSTYVVPANKVLMITDMVAASGATIAIWTDIRKVIFELDTRAVSGLTASIQLQTPLKVDSGETVCPFLFGGGSAGFYSLISGQLVDSN